MGQSRDAEPASRFPAPRGRAAYAESQPPPLKPRVNLRHRLHLLFVGLPVAFNLWALRAENNVVFNPNDSTVHYNMVRWARLQIDRGHVPLDGWFPYLSMGLSQFHHYQSFAHIITAYVSILTGTGTAYFWSLYLLLSLWPICVYIGFRLMGWDPWTAAIAALLSPVLASASGYGYEHSSYTWRGSGVWAQLWAMDLLPIAWGLSWRAVRARKSLLLGALPITLTVAIHFLTGYLALLSIGVWIVVTPRQWLQSLWRGVVIGIGAIAMASWVVVPLLVDARWAGNSAFSRGTIFVNSYPTSQILGWLQNGQVYDNGRFPIVSLLVLVGAVVCIVRFRRDERARAALGLWVMSLVIWFGRATWGDLVRVLPASDELLFHRFINGVHLSGLLLAGVGAAWMGREAISLARRQLPAIRPSLLGAGLAIVLLGLTLPAFSEILDYDEAGGSLILAQQAAEALDGADLNVLLARIHTLGPGRVYAGLPANWGHDYAIGSAPVYMVLEADDFDQVGFTLRTLSLTTDPEAYFDERNINQYDLFNIRYLLLPSDRQPSVPATLVATQGRHTLWEVDTTGYLEVVDTSAPPVVANSGNLGQQNLDFMESARLAARSLPTVAFDGLPAAEPTLGPGQAPDIPAGAVQAQANYPDRGQFSGQVIANRAAVVLLKASFDPRWKVTVDGIDRPPIMIAPSLVGVTVPAGVHTVSFEYQPFPDYPVLFLLGLLTMGLLHFGPRIAARLHRLRARRVRRRPYRASPEVARYGPRSGPPPGAPSASVADRVQAPVRVRAEGLRAP